MTTAATGGPTSDEGKVAEAVIEWAERQRWLGYPANVVRAEEGLAAFSRFRAVLSRYEAVSHAARGVIATWEAYPRETAHGGDMIALGEALAALREAQDA